MSHANFFTINLKHHVIFAFILGLWVACFLFFTEPFELWRFSLTTQLLLVSCYGLLSAIAYALTLIYQYYIFKRSAWKLSNEITFIILLCSIGLIVNYIFYYIMVPHHTEAYSLYRYTILIYIRALLIILPIVFVGRLIIKHFSSFSAEKKIVIKGSGKKDFVNLYLNQIVYLKSTNNYVELYYFEDDSLQKKVIRKTISSMLKEFSQLKQTHRSYAINPSYFKEFTHKNSNLYARLENNIDVPISRTYKKHIEHDVIHNK